jgi:hypothetical protein
MENFSGKRRLICHYFILFQIFSGDLVSIITILTFTPFYGMWFAALTMILANKVYKHW